MHVNVIITKFTPACSESVSYDWQDSDLLTRIENVFYVSNYSYKAYKSGPFAERIIKSTWKRLSIKWRNGKTNWRIVFI